MKRLRHQRGWWVTLRAVLNSKLNNCVCRLQLRAQMAIAESVLDLKQRVVWELPAHEHSKVLATYLPLQHSTSILVLPTIPINALLAHPKVVSVVSDGSIQAIYRAIYYAKPIASVALTVEQRDLVSERGACV